jgi:alpha/beta superfamily hydrolase
MEEAIHFGASALRLEGRLHVGEARAVVVTHPHPLYGGNLHNPVVEAIAASYQQRGYTTLRFNFRGVEGSQGHYDEGQGERQDLGQAIDYLQQSGCGPVELSGYSFGTWVNAHYAAKVQPDIAMTMVSPPVAFMDFRNVQRLPGLMLVMTGSRDDIAPPDLLGRLVPQWNPGARLAIVSGADHFFFDHVEELRAALSAVPAASGG